MPDFLYCMFVSNSRNPCFLALPPQPCFPLSPLLHYDMHLSFSPIQCCNLFINTATYSYSLHWPWPTHNTFQPELQQSQLPALIVQKFSRVKTTWEVWQAWRTCPTLLLLAGLTSNHKPGLPGVVNTCSGYLLQLVTSAIAWLPGYN